MSELTDASIVVTGGTGSFGRAMVRHLLEDLGARRVVVFSRDELKQHEMRDQFLGDQRLRWFLGDVRDLDRVRRAFEGVDFVIHAAALKQVDTAEYNPMEFVKTNIIGSQNVIDASLDNSVKKVVALSTDKASSPINLYGATKLTADKLFIAANHFGAARGTKFSVVRYGNVMGSRGSVIPVFRSLHARGLPIPITDPRMTRFWITIDEAVRFVVESFASMSGGELFVPRIPSMRVVDLARAVAPGSPIEEIGIRPGEKIHEEMISADDSRRTIRQPGRYVVTPVLAEWGFPQIVGEPLPDGFAYRSDTNDLWLSEHDLRTLVE